MPSPRPEYLQLAADWKVNTTLGDLAPDQRIEVWRNGRCAVSTTVRELTEQGRMPRFLTMDQVEFAFSAPDSADEVVVPIWRGRLPNGRR